MEYAVGSAGRVVAARLFEGDNVYASIESIAAAEDIRCAAVLITGGLRKAEVVVGPKSEQPRIEGDFRSFVGPGEVLGVGTIYRDDGRPKLHMHAAIGKGDLALVGCPRGGADTFLTLEVTMIEIVGVAAARVFDPATGLSLLRITPPAPSA